MLIKQDPVTKLWCRDDGAVLLPPTGMRFKKFRWTFGTRHPDGYRHVGLHHRYYQVHRLVCRAFHGMPPEDKPFVDHINRNPGDNRPGNLHWVSRKENNDNKDGVDRSIEKYGVRCCEDRKGYNKAHYAANADKIKGHHSAYYTEKKAQGFTKRKGPNGKYHWVKNDNANQG